MQFILNFKLTIPFKIFELILSQNIKVNFSIPDWQDVWILIKSGITVFRKVKNQYIEDQMFGMLMSSLELVTKKVFDGDLTTFSVGTIQFVLYQRNNFIFVGSFSKKVKEKKALNELEFFADKFFETYSSELLNNILTNWDGNIEVFSNFSKILEESPEVKFKDLF